MRIGIDIDDTITNTWSDIIPYYSIWFNIPIDTLKKSKPYYNPVKDIYTKEEYFEIIKPIYEGVVPYVSLKDNVRKVINKLHNLGHKIIFISARGKGYIDSYDLTKDYLDRNNIYYDKIIVDIDNKDKACLDEKIDLFIDDSYKHCKEVYDVGINVLMIDNDFNKDCFEFNKINNWNEIYKYIENGW